MLPLLLLIPGGWLLWTLSQRYAERRAARERAGYGYDHDGSRGEERRMYLPPSPLFRRNHRPPPALAVPLLASASSRAVVTTADYLKHLYEATMAARILDTVKPQALAGDVQGLMQSPPEVAQALELLCAPLHTVFAQKDLNVLGASPPLAEDGVMSPATAAAISGIQARFGQPVTGALDAVTAASIRYAVGCINAQDRAAAGV